MTRSSTGNGWIGNEKGTVSCPRATPPGGASSRRCIPRRELIFKPFGRVGDFGGLSNRSAAKPGSRTFTAAGAGHARCAGPWRGSEDPGQEIGRWAAILGRMIRRTRTAHSLRPPRLGETGVTQQLFHFCCREEGRVAVEYILGLVGQPENVLSAAV